MVLYYWQFDKEFFIANFSEPGAKKLSAKALLAAKQRILGLGNSITKLSKNTTNKPCKIGGKLTIKEAYLGGGIYYCNQCQRI
ncbi:MAG: hypothetical protein ACERLG_04390 [Sedimentibacter sp.]